MSIIREVPMSIRVAFVLVALVSMVNTAGSAETDWRTLPLIENGKVHANWLQIGWGHFAVVDGTLRTECDPRGMGLLLYQAEPFGNCQIEVVYRPENDRSNAGVFVRVDPAILKMDDLKSPEVRRLANGQLAPGALESLQKASEKELGPWYAVHHGYEVQICNQADPMHRTGAVYSLSKAKSLPPAPADGWRTMVITLDGQLVSVAIDGHEISRFDAAKDSATPQGIWYEPKREAKRPERGLIGLQNHDPGDVVYFKSIRVRVER